MTFVTSGQIGVNLTRTTAGTTTDGEDAEFALGARVMGSDNTEWVYAQAGEAITQYDFVAIDENFQMNQLTSTEADDGWAIGAAQVAFSDNDFGWVVTKGHNIQGRVGASCGADADLWTSATAGALDDASGTGNRDKIDGVVPVGANTLTTVSNVEILMTWPRSAGF